MEIPLDVQNKLKCSKCKALLSCGPVYMLHESGDAICGRCSEQQPKQEDSTANNDRTRNGPYEVTAAFLAFPCAFTAQGCSEKLKFCLGHQPHELSCKFRTFVCPIAPQSTCDWIGSWPNLKDHCDEKHSLNVFENPCNPPRLDLTTTNIQTYLISAFSFLFLLRLKVCITTGNIFHSVWMFGNPNFLDKFSFTLDVEAKNFKFSKLDLILSPGSMIRQNPTTVCTTIHDLLRILDGNYNESKFTITIQALFKFCLNCLKGCDSNSNFCKQCIGNLRKCKFYKKGCLFVDVNKKKCEKHENMFCEYQRKCCKCDVNLIDGSLIEHLESSSSCQNVIKSHIGSVVRITPTATSCSNFNYILFTSNIFGTVICLYKLSYSNLDVYLYTSLPSYELKILKCSLELIEPESKHFQILPAELLSNNWRDWYISKEMHSYFSLENSGIDIRINIDKK